MIGVRCNKAEARVADEFFQLFKTQWEFWVPGRQYDLILATSPEIPDSLERTPLVIFHAHTADFDIQNGLDSQSLGRSKWLRWRDIEFPVYGSVMAFRSGGKPLLVGKDSSEVVACILAGTDRPTVRVGYDLFSEIGFLLTQGQPAANSSVATLDIHIQILRQILLQLNVPFVEILPAPHGYDFMGCLTHDVDFVGIRDHKFDRTMLGFLFRCVVGSMWNAITGRLPWSRCFRNLGAAMSLPLVYLHLKADFWLEFDRYTEIERTCGSTFFFVPYKNVAGSLGPMSAPKHRAVKYDLRAISGQIQELVEKGCEIGLHGLDAWQEVTRARAEKGRITEVVGRSELGIRMHWLYWNEDSPRKLEEAGFVFDSTFGYNNAVGFRAGTAQVYRPLNAEHLLELPLIIQDSAMFYPGRMNFSEVEALKLCQSLLGATKLAGGAVTVNWHTRSLSPERLWDRFYSRLLSEMRSHRVLFGTASQVVEWFRLRRALRFEAVEFKGRQLRVVVGPEAEGPKSSFTVRAHYPGTADGRDIPTFIDYQLADEGILDHQNEYSLPGGP